MASVAVLEPADSDVVAPVAVAPGRQPALGGLATLFARAPGRQPPLSGLAEPARVLALQRTIGNAAVGRLLRAENRPIQRACCPSCATGKRCDDDEEELRANSSPPLRKRLGRRRLQRLGDVSKVPLVLTCPVAPTGVPQAVDSVMFPNAVASLTTLQLSQIENFVVNWRADGGDQPIRVDGFASTPGSDELNWQLSCDRAQTVASELQHPTSGATGIPSSLISVFMQGETAEFGSTPEANRRVTLFMPTRQPPPPRPQPEPPRPERSCGPNIDRQLTDVLRAIQRAFHDPSVSEWDRELACDNLVIPTPAAIMGWDVIDLFLPHTSWLRSGPCGVPRIDVEDPAGCGNTVEVDGKCHLAGTVNYAMYGIACRLCSDRHRSSIVPDALDQWSLADMKFWVGFYNVADTTGGGIGPPTDWATATYLHGPTGRPSGTSNRASCPVGCTTPPAHSTFDFAWPPIRGSLSH